MPLIKKNYIRNVKFGINVKITEPVNLYECEIGDDSTISCFCEIQKNVIIGNRTTISTHSFICTLVTIGNDCFIGHGVMFVNDLWKDGKLGGNEKKWKSTSIGNNVLIGSNSTILPVNICDNVTIGAGSVVTKDIEKKGIYAGNPAKLIKKL